MVDLILQHRCPVLYTVSMMLDSESSFRDFSMMLLFKRLTRAADVNSGDNEVLGCCAEKFGRCCTRSGVVSRMTASNFGMNTAEVGFLVAFFHDC